MYVSDASEGRGYDEAPLAALPDDATLEAGLAEISACTTVRLHDRTPNPYWTTQASELVSFERADGTIERVFCKYGGAIESDAHHAYGHRWGVPYEARVYQTLLRRIAPDVPMLRGVWSPDGGRTTWLVLQAFEDALPVKFAEPSQMTAAAAWIARFHSRTAASDAVREAALNRYDERYYRGWITRTRSFGASRELTWLQEVCRRAHATVTLLLEAPIVVIHGEYFPHNVLCDQEGIHPIDWESAAIAPGEIDLATLVDRWDATTIDACERAYQAARTTECDAAAFDERLFAARLHVQFRWLGDLPHYTSSREADWRFDALRQLAQTAGWL